MNALTLINNDNDNSKTRRKGKNKHTKISNTYKHRTGKKGQRTDAYFLDATNKERNKQTKVRFDTHRREEQPDAEDVRLENIHFDNFLGNSTLIKNCETEYNTEATININLCDISRPEPSELGLDLDVDLNQDQSQWIQEQRADHGYSFDPNDIIDYEHDEQPFDEYEEESDYYYDEEEDRRENYTEMRHDRGTWRIWHPASNSFVEDDDDDHSCY
jgi:hypothetical protein